MAFGGRSGFRQEATSGFLGVENGIAGGRVLFESDERRSAGTTVVSVFPQQTAQDVMGGSD